jgi:hypothetical protein
MTDLPSGKSADTRRAKHRRVFLFLRPLLFSLVSFSASNLSSDAIILSRRESCEILRQLVFDVSLGAGSRY